MDDKLIKDIKDIKLLSPKKGDIVTVTIKKDACYTSEQFENIVQCIFKTFDGYDGVNAIVIQEDMDMDVCEIDHMIKRLTVLKQQKQLESLNNG